MDFVNNLTHTVIVVKAGKVHHQEVVGNFFAIKELTEGIKVRYSDKGAGSHRELYVDDREVHQATFTRLSFFSDTDQTFILMTADAQMQIPFSLANQVVDTNIVSSICLPTKPCAEADPWPVEQVGAGTTAANPLFFQEVPDPNADDGECQGVKQCADDDGEPIPWVMATSDAFGNEYPLLIEQNHQQEIYCEDDWELLPGQSRNYGGFAVNPNARQVLLQLAWYKEGDSVEDASGATVVLTAEQAKAANESTVVRVGDATVSASRGAVVLPGSSFDGIGAAFTVLALAGNSYKTYLTMSVE